MTSGNAGACLSTRPSAPALAMPSRFEAVRRRVGKPPNILILCSEDEKRERIGGVLKGLVASDRYIIYDIPWDQLKLGGWDRSTALLIVAGEVPQPQEDESGGQRVCQFLADGGHVLSWGCLEAIFGHSCQETLEIKDSKGISKAFKVSMYGREDVSRTDEEVAILYDGSPLGGKALLLSGTQFDHSNISLLSKMLGFLNIETEKKKTLNYTSGYLIGDPTKIQDFISSFSTSSFKMGDVLVEIVPRGKEPGPATPLRLPLLSSESPHNFSERQYYDNLETSELGRLVIYADVMSSTQRVLEGAMPLRHGLVVIARQQTSGRGRGGNTWLSPEGSALFSIQLWVPLTSNLGQHISLLQHLAGLAVVLSVSVEERNRIGLRVKWPNDIYAGLEKIGGILVSSVLQGKRAVITVGIGVNVNNAYPTLCLNALLFPQDFHDQKDAGAWTTEKLIAKTLTQLEKLINLMETKDGLDHILELYQTNWIHSTPSNLSPNEEEFYLVKVETSEGKFDQCRIIGVDEFGFLKVQDVNSSSEFSVRPDGNSFDIANRLIAFKH